MMSVSTSLLADVWEGWRFCALLPSSWALSYDTMAGVGLERVATVQAGETQGLQVDAPLPGVAPAGNSCSAHALARMFCAEML